MTKPLAVNSTVKTDACAAKVALTVRAWLIVTTQVAPAPVQAPPQAEKTWPPAGVGVSVTTVLVAKGALQVVSQLRPAGCDCTVPLPLICSDSVCCAAGGAVKDAVTVRAMLIDTVQVAVVTDEGSGAETRRTYRLPLRATGDLKHVASFSVL